MANKVISITLKAVDVASKTINSVTKAVDNFERKHKSMASSVSGGITQALGPYVAFSKMFQGLGASMEEFEKRTGKTTLKDLKGSLSDVTAQIGAGLYPAFEAIGKIVNDNKERFLLFGAQVGKVFSGLTTIVVNYFSFFTSMVQSVVGAAMEKFYQLKSLILWVFGKKEMSAQAKAEADAIAENFESVNAQMVDSFGKMGKGIGTVFDGITGKVQVSNEALKKVDKKANEEMLKARKEATKTFESDMYKLVTEENSKTYKGKLINAERAAEKELDVYKKYLKDGLISKDQYAQIEKEIEKKKAADIQEIEKEHKSKINAINDASNMEQLQAKINNNNEKLNLDKTFENDLYKLTTAQNEKTLSGRLTNVKQAAELEITTWAQAADAGMITKEQYAQMELAIEQDKSDKIKEINLNRASEILDIASQGASSLSTINSMLSEQANTDIDNEVENKKAAATATIKNKAQLEKELAKIDKDAEKKRKEIAKNEQKISLVQSIINTAQGVTKAIAQEGVLGLITGILVGAAGAVQSGIIASQAFAGGGVIRKQPGVAATGDQTLIAANPGERVLTKEQNAAYERGGSGGVTIGDTQVIIQGNADKTVVQSVLRESREQQMVNMRKLMLEMRYNNMLPAMA